MSFFSATMNEMSVGKMTHNPFIYLILLHTFRTSLLKNGKGLLGLEWEKTALRMTDDDVKSLELWKKVFCNDNKNPSLRDAMLARQKILSNLRFISFVSLSLSVFSHFWL